ncbi:3'-5' exonuclease [Ruminiclostridium cellulolyticum]|uniref:Exonuclease RNase T and DNA polymerase III n=1 Tax=Ruminiclostridium cellulolyticum (strain ATCC 35319 / DSM 5812 / JCM 6584 / H10) TaxID=394503 RepID=B8I4N0_RUMCH|nr:3'-5' exonuclease [Ruminiclostridium cellulolyticum]ACL76534.1 Exonuclease RNase T and DNA polymerase III [Ruminiclostridium cellulolyticum H10]
MLIFVDFEATCWDKNEKYKQPHAEIIEIGAVATGKDLKEIGKFSAVVKPTIEPLLSDYCKELTGLSQTDVENGIEFNRAIDLFYQWIIQYQDTDTPILYTWGNYDGFLLKRNLRRHRNKNKDFLKIIQKGGVANLQEKFLEFTKLPCSSCSLTKALQIIGEDYRGIKHRSINDAANMIKLYKYLGS